MIKDQNRSEERKIPRDHPLRSKNNLNQKDFGANKHCCHQKQGSKANSSLKYPPKQIDV
jgi:hypothetical protein